MDQSDGKQHVETLEHAAGSDVRDVKTLKESDLIDLKHSSYKEGKTETVESVALVCFPSRPCRVSDTN